MNSRNLSNQSKLPLFGRQHFAHQRPPERFRPTIAFTGRLFTAPTDVHLHAERQAFYHYGNEPLAVHDFADVDEI